MLSRDLLRRNSSLLELISSPDGWETPGLVCFRAAFLAGPPLFEDDFSGEEPGGRSSLGECGPVEIFGVLCGAPGPLARLCSRCISPGWYFPRSSRSCASAGVNSADARGLGFPCP